MNARISLTLALLLLVHGLARAEQPRANIIAVVTDDQARWAVGIYGNREIKTPNMDRLGQEGAVFENAFTVTPVCSPSRATYLTGMYGTQLGITDYLSPDEEQRGAGLPASAVTWPEVLQSQGYATGLVGKWHLGSKPEFHPTRHGFTHFAGFLGGATKPLNPTLEIDGQTREVQGFVVDILTDQAIRFVENNAHKPFALCLHYREPHLPYVPVPEEDAAVFKDLDPTVPQPPGGNVDQIKGWMRDYFSSIHAIDRNLGRLLRRLDELKLTQRTIVLFTSDHGYMIGHHGIHTKGNGHWIAGGVTGPKRPNMFDDSLRVPLLVRWPGVVQPGTRIEQMVTNLDMLASVLGMVNAPLPTDAKQSGLDFSRLLRGENVPWRNEIYGQYDLHNLGLAYMRMIRTPEWKLVRHHRVNGLDELYDLRNDPQETRNLFGQPQHRARRDELQKRLSAWQKSIDDPLLRQ